MKCIHAICFGGLFLLILLAGGCSTDFEVLAPKKDILFAWCVLDPADSVQYVRVSEAFLREGDAVAYAEATDLSLEDMKVVLRGGGQTWTAAQSQDQPREPGLFPTQQTAYRFDTPPGHALQAGIRYQLEISKPDTTFRVEAFTTTPGGVSIEGELLPVSKGTTNVCLPEFVTWKDSEIMIRTRGSSQQAQTAAAYEFRVRMIYEADGQPDTLVFGPTPPFEDNKGCPAGQNMVCYKLRKFELLPVFQSQLKSGSLSYSDEPHCAALSQVATLGRSLEFEVTAMDEELYRYMRANSPAFPELTGAKKEYTNFSGSVAVYGIFGAVQRHRRFASMDLCGKWHLGFANGSTPTNDCIIQ